MAVAVTDTKSPYANTNAGNTVIPSRGAALLSWALVAEEHERSFVEGYVEGLHDAADLRMTPVEVAHGAEKAFLAGVKFGERRAWRRARE
jgi:hypothetical protein